MSELQQVSHVVRTRRTNLRIDRDRPVDRELLSQLIELSTWAPNHRMTEPWRFAVLTGSARRELGERTAQHQELSGETDPAKLNKTRTKFERASTLVVVASETPADAPDDLHTEDRDATAAAVQTLLLAATAAGLNSYWGSGAVCHAPGVHSLCGFSPQAKVVAVVYLGYSIGDVPVPSRKPPVIKWLGETE